MAKWIDYCNTKLPHNLKFENTKNIIEAMGRRNDMGDVVVFVIEKYGDVYSFLKLIGTHRGWISIEIYFFNVPTLKMAREMLKLKMEEW